MSINHTVLSLKQHRFSYLSIGTVVGLSIFFAYASVVYADIGPKPSLQFTFEYNIEKIPIVELELINCDNLECRTGEPPYGFVECQNNICTSMAGFYSDYQKLVVTFEDKTRESNVFRKKAFSAQYIVTVEENELHVEDVTGWQINPWITISVMIFSIILFLTLGIELIIARVYFWIIKAKEIAKQLGWVIVANIISLSVMWLLVVTFNIVESILLLELFVVIFEALFLYKTNRKQGLSLVQAGVLSIAMNTASYLFGLFLTSGFYL